jgi:hypothetical protein
LFWTDGYKERLYLDDQGSPMAYDRMVLGIGGKEVATRGYKESDNVAAKANSVPTAEPGSAAGSPDIDL